MSQVNLETVLTASARVSTQSISMLAPPGGMATSFGGAGPYLVRNTQSGTIGRVPATRATVGNAAHKKSSVLMCSVAIQVQPTTCDTESYTGNDLEVVFGTKGGDAVLRKSKNQLVLDRAMEQEFNLTLEIFDEFAK